MTALIDHLVVVATTLEEGVAWCEDTLGVTPGAGGSHALMGTHNRLLRIATEDFPTAYLEIISIQPGASPTKAPGSQRWFDMDDPALRNQIARHGPQLVHFVASVPNVHAAVASLTALGIECGEVVQASRPTPAGLLQWMMTIRPDGQRLLMGACPH